MDKKIFFALLFVAATGLCAGAFFEVYMSGSGKDQLMTLLDNFFQPEHAENGESLSPLVSFWLSVRGSLLVLLLFFLSPVLLVLLPLCPIWLFLLGLSTGFSATMLIEAFGATGLRYAGLTLVPPAFLQILLFSFLGMVSLQAKPAFFSLRAFSFGGRPQRRVSPTTVRRVAGHPGSLPLPFQAFYTICSQPYLLCYTVGLLALLLINLCKVFLLQCAI